MGINTRPKSSNFYVRHPTYLDKDPNSRKSEHTIANLQQKIPQRRDFAICKLCYYSQAHMKENPATKDKVSQYMQHDPRCSLAHDSDVSDDDQMIRLDGLKLNHATMKRVVFERRVYPISGSIGHFDEAYDSQEEDVVLQSALTLPQAPTSKRRRRKQGQKKGSTLEK